MLTVSRETKTCIIELLNDFTDFRIIIVKSYLEESNIQDFIQNLIQDSIQDSIQDFIQDSIQDFIQNSIKDSIQDFIQLKDFVQSEELRRNFSRSRQRLTRV